MADNQSRPPVTLALPALNPLVSLHKGPDLTDGTPSWTLHHPVSNKYYQIGWAEFECLARFHRHEDCDALIKAVNAETTLEVDQDDVEALIRFLHQNGLVSGADALAPKVEGIKKQSILMKIMHHYLFFTLPLFHPDNFLNKTYRYFKFIWSKPFLIFSYGLLLTMVFATFQRADEFLHTFFSLFSLQGAIMVGVLFMGIKILHEFGHAYTAVKYKVPVPHMGIAFMVLYPVLYTETTGIWRLQSKHERMHIGLAGIATELVIAAYALLLWNILPPGLGQSLAFGVVAISLIGSLLINLNPLMRFDGYYVMSDAISVENLHSRSLALARWKLREFLFAWGDDAPENFSHKKQNFLTSFGFAVMIYRFFLFSGIALLVFHVFFQPLGLILMLVELAFFIALPIWKELVIWYERRGDSLKHKRFKLEIAGLALIILLLILPLQSTVSIPAIYHAQDYRAVYPSAPAQITQVNVSEGDDVQKGDILLKLASLSLERDIKAAALSLESLEHLKRREQTDQALYRERRASIDEDIEAAKEKLESLKRRQDQMIIRADFDGKVLDMSPDIHTGRTVNSSHLLLRLVASGPSVLSAYASDEQLARISEGNQGTFQAGFSAFQGMSFRIKKLASVNASTLEWPELSSIYSGPIASEFFKDSNGEHAIFPRQSLYAIELEATQDQGNIYKNQSLALRGWVDIKGTRISPAATLFKRLYAFFIRESGFNQT